MEHPKTSYKFSKIKRQTEMVPLAIYTLKQKNSDEKNVKIT